MGRKSKATLRKESDQLQKQIVSYLKSEYDLDIDVPMDREIGLQIVSILVFNSKDRKAEDVGDDIYRAYVAYQNKIKQDNQ